MNSKITNHLTWLVSKMSEVNEFENWSADFKIKQIEKSFALFYSSLITSNCIDIENLTVEEAKELRFVKWGEDMPNLYLFPLWIVPLIPDGTEVISINGERIKYSKGDMDNDIRFDCVSYGINIIDHRL